MGTNLIDNSENSKKQIQNKLKIILGQGADYREKKQMAKHGQEFRYTISQIVKEVMHGFTIVLIWEFKRPARPNFLYFL
jgi:hypothetical protein